MMRRKIYIYKHTVSVFKLCNFNSQDTTLQFNPLFKLVNKIENLEMFLF